MVNMRKDSPAQLAAQRATEGVRQDEEAAVRVNYARVELNGLDHDGPLMSHRLMRSLRLSVRRMHV